MYIYYIYVLSFKWIHYIEIEKDIVLFESLLNSLHVCFDHLNCGNLLHIQTQVYSWNKNVTIWGRK